MKYQLMHKSTDVVVYATAENYLHYNNSIAHILSSKVAFIKRSLNLDVCCKKDIYCCYKATLMHPI